MKKSDLWIGIGFIAAGLALLSAAILAKLHGSLLYGFSGALIGPGIAQIAKYVKWTRPKNAPIYRERLEQERIELRDERKTMLRDKSGRYAYILGMIVAVVLELAVVILGDLGVIEKNLWLPLGILFYVCFQYAAGLVIYALLDRKY